MYVTGTKQAHRLPVAVAAGLVRTGEWVDCGAVLARPEAFDNALATRISDLGTMTRVEFDAVDATLTAA